MAATTSYLELDAADLRTEDRPLLGLLAPDALEPGGLFDRLVTESHRFGAELRTRLDEEIRTSVLPQLAQGFGSWAASAGRDLADPAVRRDIENASLTWVFRALFVLYAESADLPVDHVGYQPTALTTLTEQAADTLGLLDPKLTSLWIASGCSCGLCVLVTVLSACLQRRPLLSHLAARRFGARDGEHQQRHVRAGARLPGPRSRDRSGNRRPSLEIGHLGHLYEGMLSLHVAVADTDLALYPTGEKKSLRYEPGKETCGRRSGFR